MTDLKRLIATAAGGKPLSRREAAEAFDIIMSGEATPAQMGGFLMALRVRGETVDEIAAAAELVMGKIDAVPVAVVRGLGHLLGEGHAQDLVRPAETDLFR